MTPRDEINGQERAELALDLACAYEEGATIRSLVRSGLGYSQVRRLLIEQGVKLRTSGRRS